MLDAGGEALRAVRTLAIGLAGLLLVLALSAWLVPPLLDWGRYRATIAAVAAARLGRPVEIGGAVTLRLLPHAILTASEVTLPDQGDGLSARLATLRLQVALGPLLGGRILATDLVLGAPVLRLPWPLPAAITDPLRRPVPRGFGARIEGGSLTVGALALGGINASLVGDAAAGTLRASGEAEAGSLPWRFRAVLGAPGQSGASSVDIAVAGQDRLRDTGGRFSGTLSGAELAGDLDLGGGDLALLLPGPRLPWSVRGAMSARRDRIEAPALALESGGGRAQGRVALSLAGPPRLDMAIATPAFVPALWSPLAARALWSPLAARALWSPLAARAASLDLPFTFDLSADRAKLLGDQVTGLSLRIAGDGTGTRLERARALLPGGAVATVNGQLGSDAAGRPMIAGPATLDAPDLRTTLQWLRPLAPALLDAVSDWATRNAAIPVTRLQGRISVADEGFEVKALTGTLGDDHVEGDFAAHLGTRPGVTADLLVDRLALDPAPPRIPIRLTEPGLDADVQLQARSSSIWGLALADLALHARTDAGGVQILKASAKLAGAAVSVSGSMAVGGALTDGRLTAEIHDLSDVLAEAPPGWQSHAPLWRGPATLELSASGPQDALGLQLRASAGDLRIEAESLLNAGMGSATATITLRHPGAPRLLADLGLPGAEAWLDTGSAALISHLRVTPWRVEVQDFDLNAAALRVAGHADADLSGKVPKLDATLLADTLPLPGWANWLGVPNLPAWAATSATRLHVQAAKVLAGLSPVATNASAEIGIEQGMVLAEPIHASLAGGALSAAVAADLAQSPPRLAARADLAGATLQGPLPGLPISPADTAFDLTASLDAAGASPAALAASAAGEAKAVVKSTSINGLDLPRLILGFALPRRSREAALRAAITSGATAGFAGTLDAGLAGSRLMVTQGLLAAPSGTLNISGSGDLTAETVNLHIVAIPAMASPPQLGIDFSGSWDAPRRTDALGDALRWGPHPQSRAPPATRHAGKRHRRSTQN